MSAPETLPMQRAVEERYGAPARRREEAPARTFHHPLLCALFSLACAAGGATAPAASPVVQLESALVASDPGVCTGAAGVSPVVQLESALVALPGATGPEEAARLARTAFEVTAELRARHRPLTPPHLGNLAFHLGLRERALCCHWVEDLLLALSALELESIELHWGVAHFGSTLREHSAVVAVPTGASFGQGLVLDAWRNSGHLYWTRVDRDRYPWQPHPSDDAREQLACGSDAPADR